MKRVLRRKPIKNKMETNKKKYDTVTIALIILLGIRLAGQVFFAILSFSDVISLVIYFFTAVLYFIALVGVFMKERWGSVMSAIIGIIDIIFASVLMVGSTAFGTVIFDLVMILLAYGEYKQVTSRPDTVSGKL